MVINKKYFLIIVVVILLSVNIAYAKEWNEHDFKVQDKRIENGYSGVHYYINTLEFGDIGVSREDYFKCFINDTITVKNEWGSSWLIKINGEPV